MIYEWMFFTIMLVVFLFYIAVLVDINRRDVNNILLLAPAWLFIVFFCPVFGSIIYFLMQNRRATIIIEYKGNKYTANEKGIVSVVGKPANIPPKVFTRIESPLKTSYKDSMHIKSCTETLGKDQLMLKIML